MAEVHSSLEATVVVGGGFLLLAGPALWWVLFRMDEGSKFENVPDEIESLSGDDIRQMENRLGVKLPDAYATFLQGGRDSGIDNTTVLDSAAPIIEATEEYRKGFSGLPPWPTELIYVGDEADACPYTLNCNTGEVLRTDKGNLDRPPLARYGSFSEFVGSREADDV